MEHKYDGDTGCNLVGSEQSPRLHKMTGKLRNQRTNGDHPETTAELRSTRILRRVKETRGNLL